MKRYSHVVRQLNKVSRATKSLCGLSLALLIVATYLFADAAQAQVSAEIRSLNPKLKGLGAKAAAVWRLTDLTNAQGGPLVGRLSYGINAADFDNDGDVDLVVTFQSGGMQAPNSEATAGIVFWLENITTRPGVDLAYRVHLLDNQQLTPKDVVVLESAGDGNRAAVIPCYLSGETILYQTSDGKTWDKVWLRSDGLKAPVRAVVADVDQSGTDDIVVTSIAETGDSIAWFRRRPGECTAWEAVSMRVELPPLVGVDAGDVDGDGDLDLVCASEHSPHPFLLINVDGAGMDWRKEPMQARSPDSVRRWVASFSKSPVSQNHVKLADIDRDGDLDCVETSLKNGYVAWRENVSNSSRWAFHAIAGGLEGAYCFDVGDVDRDNRIDIVVPSGDTDGVYVFRNAGDNGDQWEVTRLGDRAGLNWANIVRLADLDADGYVDILATDWGKKAVLWSNPFGPTKPDSEPRSPR